MPPSLYFALVHYCAIAKCTQVDETMLLRIAHFWASRLIFFSANKQDKACSGGTSYLAALLHPLIYFLFHPVTFLGNSTRNKIQYLLYFISFIYTLKARGHYRGEW